MILQSVIIYFLFTRRLEKTGLNLPDQKTEIKSAKTEVAH
jgi:hypothetical protein